MADQGDLQIETGNFGYVAGFSIDDPDFVVVNGDLSLITNEELIKRSIIRRITTKVGDYSKLIYGYKTAGSSGTAITETETVENGTDYGSDLGTLLSEPFNLVFIQKLKTKLFEAINKDDRINVLDIQFELKQEFGEIKVTVSYELTDSSETGTLTTDVVMN